MLQCKAAFNSSFACDWLWRIIEVFPSTSVVASHRLSLSRSLHDFPPCNIHSVELEWEAGKLGYLACLRDSIAAVGSEPSISDFLSNMEAVEAVLIDPKCQLEVQSAQPAAQARQITQLNKNVDRLRSEVLWKPLTSFDLFSKLPTEIRYEIWRLAMSAPRILTLVRDPAYHRYESVWIDRGNRLAAQADLIRGSKHMRYTRIDDGTWREEEYSRAFTRFQEYPAADHHALLYVCRESRQVALSAYERCMTTSAAKNLALRLLNVRDSESEVGITIPEIFSAGHRFVPALDTVYLKNRIANWDICLYLSICDPRELDTGKIQSLAVPYIAYYELDMTVLFKGLKKVIVVASKDDVEDGEEREEREAGLGICIEAVRAKLADKIKEHECEQLIVMVMTENMLFEYVGGNYNRDKAPYPAFRAITPLDKSAL